MEGKGINKAHLLWYTSFGNIQEQQEGGQREFFVKVVHKATVLDNPRHLQHRNSMGFSPAGVVYSTKILPLIVYRGLMEFYRGANKTIFLAKELSFITTIGLMFSNVSPADIYARLLADD